MARFLLTAVAVCSAVAAHAAIQETSVLDAGGGRLTGGGITMQGSLGHCIVATSVSAAATLQHGFVPQIANLQPSASADAADCAGLHPILIAVLANDTDPDRDPLGLRSVGPGAHGTCAIVDARTVRYTPMPGPGFTGSDRFAYVVSDGQGDIAVGICSIHYRDLRQISVVLLDSHGASVAADVHLAGLDGGLIAGPGEGHIPGGVFPGDLARHAFELAETAFDYAISAVTAPARDG